MLSAPQDLFQLVRISILYKLIRINIIARERSTNRTSKEQPLLFYSCTDVSSNLFTCCPNFSSKTTPNSFKSISYYSRQLLYPFDHTSTSLIAFSLHKS